MLIPSMISISIYDNIPVGTILNIMTVDMPTKMSTNIINTIIENFQTTCVNYGGDILLYPWLIDVFHTIYMFRILFVFAVFEHISNII